MAISTNSNPSPPVNALTRLVGDYMRFELAIDAVPVLVPIHFYQPSHPGSCPIFLLHKGRIFVQPCVKNNNNISQSQQYFRLHGPRKHTYITSPDQVNHQSRNQICEMLINVFAAFLIGLLLL